MKPYLILKSFKGSQTGQDFRVFREGEICPLSDDLARIVDCIRHLRGSKARLHTKVEIPFYTGVRKPAAELVASLP